MQSDKCCGGWLFASVVDTDQMNYAYYVENCSEQILSLLGEAEAHVESAAQLSELELVRACHLYHGCLGSYFPAYETQDGERMALIEARYAEALLLLSRNGLDPKAIGTVGGPISFPDDVHELAWTDWCGKILYPDRTKRSGRENLLRQFGMYDEGTTLRDAPEEYK